MITKYKNIYKNLIISWQILDKGRLKTKILLRKQINKIVVWLNTFNLSGEFNSNASYIILSPAFWSDGSSLAAF